MQNQQIQFPMKTTYSFREGYKAAQNNLIDCPFAYPSHVKDWYDGYEYFEKEQSKDGHND